MSNHKFHEEHQHEHSLGCGHTKIYHNGHIDFLHKNHLHHKHDDHWDECRIEVSDINPEVCQSISCACAHNEDCGHEMVPHGDHMDYLVNGRLHHIHGDHCDDHGSVEIITIQSR